MSESDCDEAYRRAKWLASFQPHQTYFMVGPLSIAVTYNPQEREFLTISVDGAHTESGLMERVYRATNGRGHFRLCGGAELVIPMLRQAMILQDLADV